MSTPSPNSLPAGLKAYLFDLDGTLLNTTPDIAHAVNIARAEYALPPLTEKEVEQGVGRGAMALMRATFPPSFHERITEVRETFARAYQAAVCVNTHPYSHAIDLLHMIRLNGAKVGLITNKPERFAIPLLNALGMSQLFDLQLYGDSLPEKKPSPLPLINAMKQLQVSPEHCIYVGDTEVDAEATRAANMPFAVVEWGRFAQQATHSGEEFNPISFTATIETWGANGQA